MPFARHSQPTGIPRPHQWLLMGVQACRLPAPKPLKHLKRSKPSKRSKPLKPLNIRFFLHSAVLDGKLIATHCAMVYLPCLHVTGHSPFARGANINIRFFLHNAILHKKLYLSNSIYLSLYLSISLCIDLSIYLSFFLSFSLPLSLYRGNCLCLYVLQPLLILLFQLGEPV